jgi:NAD(P)H-hydrate epimerase
MKLVTVSQMRAIEQEADSNGLSYAQMMENAGRGLAEEIQSLAFGQEEREALGLVGPGNNGGDTLVALAHLAAEEWRTRAYLVRRNPANDPLIERARKAGVDILLAEEDLDYQKLSSFVESADVVVDGILGTGFQLPLRPETARVLDAVNQAVASLNWPPYVVAVDCPSGVDSDSGLAAAETIPASLTVCMAAVKRGLLQLPAFDLAGELRVVEIGLSEELKSWDSVHQFVVNEEMVAAVLPDRPSDAHKGTFGTALVVAGSANYPGAALLAGKAAYRVGAGLVQMAVPALVQGLMASSLPEATWALLPHEMGSIAAGAADVLTKNFERATALLIGPGLGTEDTTAKFIENCLKGKASARKTTSIGFVHGPQSASEDKARTFPALVFDADGLRLLAKLEKWPSLLPAQTVLTPHPGEMSALTGLEKDEIQQDRLNIAMKYAAEWGHVVVLKGAFTVIAAPDGRIALIPVASAALARAGSGDVLAGLIVGLRAQGLPAFEAAFAGAWIHAQAGLLAAEKLGSEAAVLAGDILETVPDALSGF